MNKEKIIQMIEDYGTKQYEAGVNYGPADDMDADDFKDLQMRIYNIKNELNSKPVMPKVFDEWIKLFGLNDYDDMKLKLIAELYINFDEMKLNDVEFNLSNWLHDPINIFPDEDRYLKCVDAIVNGYEVKK